MLQRELGFIAGKCSACIIKSLYSFKKKYNYRVCHANMMDMKEIRKCQCKNLAIVRYEHFNNDEKDLKKKL